MIGVNEKKARGIALISLEHLESYYQLVGIWF